jgi:integrase
MVAPRLEELGAASLSSGCAVAGVEGARPYDLCHSLCSLLLYDGRTIVQVARQAGHAPSMSLDTYQHVMDELEGVERVPAEEQIRRARARLVPVRTR